MKARVVGFLAVGTTIAALGMPPEAATLDRDARPIGFRAWSEDAPAVGAGGPGADAGLTLLAHQPAPVSPRRPALLRRLRKNTVSLGGQVSYGFVRGSSELNDHFDNGFGYAFRFRYMLSSRTALGFSFENQRYGSRIAPNPQPLFPADSQLVITSVASEAVVYFHRERLSTPYLLGGLGYASPNVTYGEKESRRVNEGPYVVVGVGVEKFVRPKFAFDFTLRGYGQMGNSELSLFSQLSAGIHLYPGD